MFWWLFLIVPLISGQWLNDNCHRTVDVSTPSLLREKRAIAIIRDDVTSKKGKTDDEYLVCVELPPNATLAFLSAKEKDGVDDLPLSKKDSKVIKLLNKYSIKY